MKNVTWYKEFRKVGYTAQRAYDAADIYTRFLLAQAQGLVKIRAEYEEESYFDVYGEPDTKKERDEICRLIDQWGMYCVLTEAKCPCCGSWELSDSIGMCIYNDPLSPFENDYVIDLMDSALKAIKEA